MKRLIHALGTPDLAASAGIVSLALLALVTIARMVLRAF